ncbi:hypothetical protein GB937_008111 [Aspergillus fischeri]|nr:hypothetical protein GB937_008111 [Aspergillus fischeri]
MLKPYPWAILLRSSNSRLDPDYNDHVKLSDRTGTQDQWDDRKLLRAEVAYCVHGDPGSGTTPGNMAVRVRALPTSP